MINLALLKIMYNIEYKVLASWHVNSCSTLCLVQRKRSERERKRKETLAKYQCSFTSNTFAEKPMHTQALNYKHPV